MQESTTPEPDPAIDENEHPPYEFNIRVTQQDPELRAIEATLVILQMLPYDTRVRALTYIRSRVESDPAVWGGGHPEPPPAEQLATHDDIAQILAESDGHDWGTMAPYDQAPYYRSAKALSSFGLAVIRGN